MTPMFLLPALVPVLPAVALPTTLAFLLPALVPVLLAVMPASVRVMLELDLLICPCGSYLSADQLLLHSLLAAPLFLIRLPSLPTTLAFLLPALVPVLPAVM